MKKQRLPEDVSGVWLTPFEELPGIISIRSGYTGGHTENPTYEEVCTETTGHAEARTDRIRSSHLPIQQTAGAVLAAN